MNRVAGQPISRRERHDARVGDAANAGCSRRPKCPVRAELQLRDTSTAQPVGGSIRRFDCATFQERDASVVEPNPKTISRTIDHERRRVILVAERRPWYSCDDGVPGYV